MANPQRENGHTRIANEILDRAMSAKLNGSQFKLVLAVWRYTYGFQRKQHRLSLSFLAKATGLNKRTVQDEIDNLIDLKVIFADTSGQTRALGFNKNYDEWELEKMTEKKAAPKKKREYTEDSVYYKMAEYFIQQITAVAEDAGVPHLVAKANVQKSADDFRKLMELDGVSDKKLIHEVMKWATSHYFWHRNILSAKKFREKFGELAIQMNAESKPAQQKLHPSHYKNDDRDREIEFNKWINAGGSEDDFVFSGDR